MDVTPGLQMALQQMENDRRAEQEAKRLQFQREQSLLENDRANKQLGISQGYLDLGKQDRTIGEEQRKRDAAAAREKQVEQAWAGYMTAQRSGSPSLLAEAAARLQRLGVNPEGPNIPTSPGIEPEMATPIEAGSSEAIVPEEDPYGLGPSGVAPSPSVDAFAEQYGSSVEDVNLEEDSVMQWRRGDVGASAADPFAGLTNGPGYEGADPEFKSKYPDRDLPEDVHNEYARKLGEYTRALEGQKNLEIPDFVPPGDENTYLALLARGEPMPEEWTRAGENVPPAEPDPLGYGVPEGDSPPDVSTPLTPSAMRFRDSVTGTIYESPGESANANPQLVRKSLSALVEGAPSEEHKAAAEQAIQLAESAASGPDVTFEEAIELGTNFYEMRSRQLEARSLQEMRSANRGGGGGAPGGFGKAETARLRGMSSDTLDEIRLLATQEKFGGLQQTQRDVNEVLAKVQSKDALSQRGAIGSLLRQMSGAAATDQERSFYLHGVGLPNAVLDKWANLAEGGELNETLLLQLRDMMRGASGRLGQERKRIGSQAYGLVMRRSGAMSPEEREAEARRAQGFFIGYDSLPSQPSEPTTDELLERAP